MTTVAPQPKVGDNGDSQAKASNDSPKARPVISDPQSLGQWKLWPPEARPVTMVTPPPPPPPSPRPVAIVTL